MAEEKAKIVARSGDWLAVQSRSRPGEIYYFNSRTRATMWNKPPSFAEEPAKDVKEASVKLVDNPVVKLSKNSFKMKTKRRNDTAGEPYPKRRSEDAADKTNKQETERKNLGNFKHTFNPPSKSSSTPKDTAKEEPTKASVKPLPSSNAPVSVSLKQKTPNLVRAPIDIFGEGSEIPSGKTSTVTRSSPSTRPAATASIPNVPFDGKPSKLVVKAQIQEIPPALLPKLQKGPPGKQLKRLSAGGAKPLPSPPIQPQLGRRSRQPVVGPQQPAVRPQQPAVQQQQSAVRPQQPAVQQQQSAVRPQQPAVQQQQSAVRPRQSAVRQQQSAVRPQSLSRSPPREPIPRVEPPGPRRRSGGLAEERLRKLRTQLSADVQAKGVEKKESAPVLSLGEPKEPAQRKALLPTPPECFRMDVLEPQRQELTRQKPSSVCQTPVTLTVNQQPSRGSEAPRNIPTPSVEVFRVEAMDVDEEAQLLSDIKALRTAATWESFDIDSTPMETEVVGVSQETRSAVILVIDTNILLSNLQFVEELRDTTKLCGHHPIIYIPWMVQQELDRLKERPEKIAKSARAAVRFLNDSFKRKHPRVRGQSGREAREARGQIEHLTPDDFILESCLQLKDQGFETWLLSNDENFCNKAMVSSIKAVSKTQLTNEIRNPAETMRLLHTGRSPSPVKKANVMSRLSNASQRNSTQSQPQPQPVNTQIPDPTPSVIEDLKTALLSTFSRVISTGMKAEYGEGWPKRVLYKPPWEIHKMFVCLANHWFALCDESCSDSVRTAVNRLKAIFQKGADDNAVNEIIDEVMTISSRLHRKYSDIVSPLEKQMKAFQASGKMAPSSTDGVVNGSVSHELSLRDTPTNVAPATPNTHQDSIPNPPRVMSPNASRAYNLVLLYLEEFWNIVSQCWMTLRAKLEMGITLDTDTVNHTKEVLTATEQLYHAINGILAVPADDVNSTLGSLRELYELLKNVSVPQGAEPLTFEHVLTFCAQPESRVILRNGSSKLFEVGAELDSAVKSNRPSM